MQPNDMGKGQAKETPPHPPFVRGGVRGSARLRAASPPCKGGIGGGRRTGSRMVATRALAALAGVLAVLAAAPAAAAGVPVLAGIDPPGVQAGGTVVWTVNGRSLAGVERFLISGSGVEAVAIAPASDESIRLSVRTGADALPGFREFRAIGPSGISNLVLFRVDSLPQTREAEPNDDPTQANPLVIPSAVAGVLLPQDLDRFSFLGREGQGVTVEVEARRLGSAIVPQARLFGPSGASLARSQPMRDGGGDCRLSFILPEAGCYSVEVRDALYRGSAAARYRLRIDTGPFATGLFPLGGRRGEALTITASGGNLTAPWRKTIFLPDEPGATVAPGLFVGPGGSLLAPGRLIAGGGSEIVESPGGSGTALQPTAMGLPFGATVNGRIDRPGKIDRYSVAMPRGEAVQVQVEVQAAALGSWLDSVVTLVDAHGNAVAEADDRGTPGRRAAGLDPGILDSRLEVEREGGRELVVAITDRFGDGGPEYGYRLWVGPPHGDMAVALQLGGLGSRSSPGVDASGALNLRPGTTVTLPLQITAEGRPGPITLRPLGLPPGVAADPLTVRIPRAPRGVAPVPVEAALILRVDPDAGPAIGSLRIVASMRSGEGVEVTRRVSASLVLASVPEEDPRPPPRRVVTEFPVMVLGPDER